MPKTRVNISMDEDLAEFVKDFASENRTTVADVITQYILTLKRRVEGRTVENILSDPAFEKAMDEAQAKIRSGKAKWRTRNKD